MFIVNRVLYESTRLTDYRFEILAVAISIALTILPLTLTMFSFQELVSWLVQVPL